LIRVSNNEKNIPHVHLSRLPAGPSFDLKVEKFSLMSDIRRLLESGGGIGLSKQDEQFAPVAILNGFKNATAPNEFVALLCEAIKGLIPPIDISKINTKTCRRVVLFNYNTDSNKLSIRHYRVKIDSASSSSTESSSACAAILKSRKSSKIPNLGKLVSLSDLIKTTSTPDATSTNGGEDEEENCQVEIYGKKSSTKKSKAQLKLVEIGPRLECILSRVFSGVEEGTVLFAPAAPETVGKTITKKIPKRKRAAKQDIGASKKSRAFDNPEHDNEEQYFSE
jgi:ribosome biogenesis protein SSF1/2